MSKEFKFNFCPECGSRLLFYDKIRLPDAKHRYCRNCNKHWEVKLDTYNDFGEDEKEKNEPRI